MTQLKKAGILLIVICCSIFSCAKKQSNATDLRSIPDSPPLYKVTFIELGSVNCIPCKMMQPVMKEVEAEYGDQVKVVFHDVWTEAGKPFGVKYGIRAIPTQVFLDEAGEEYFRHVGFFPKEELLKVLEQKGVE